MTLYHTNKLLLGILIIIFFLAQSSCAPIPQSQGSSSLLLKNELRIDRTQPIEKQIQFEKVINKILTWGEEIETDANTIKTILFPNGVEVILKPNTRIKISSIILFVGDVIVRTTGNFFRQARKYFEVKTEPVIASMETTKFQVSVDHQGRVSILVIEGVVKLTPTVPVWQLRLLKSSQKAVVQGQQVPHITSASSFEIDETNQFIKQVDQAIHAVQVTNATVGVAAGAAAAIGIGAILLESILNKKNIKDNVD